MPTHHSTTSDAWCLYVQIGLFNSNRTELNCGKLFKQIELNCFRGGSKWTKPIELLSKLFRIDLNCSKMLQTIPNYSELLQTIFKDHLSWKHSQEENVFLLISILNTPTYKKYHFFWILTFSSPKKIILRFSFFFFKY